MISLSMNEFWKIFDLIMEAVVCGRPLNTISKVFLMAAYSTANMPRHGSDSPLKNSASGEIFFLLKLCHCLG